MYTQVSHRAQVDFTSSVQLLAAVTSQTSFPSIGILVKLWISRSTLVLMMYVFVGELGMYPCWLLMIGILSY